MYKVLLYMYTYTHTYIYIIFKTPIEIEERLELFHL